MLAILETEMMFLTTTYLSSGYLGRTFTWIWSGSYTRTSVSVNGCRSGFGTRLAGTGSVPHWWQVGLPFDPSFVLGLLRLLEQENSLKWMTLELNITIWQKKVFQYLPELVVVAVAGGEAVGWGSFHATGPQCSCNLTKFQDLSKVLTKTFTKN